MASGDTGEMNLELEAAKNLNTSLYVDRNIDDKFATVEGDEGSFQFFIFICMLIKCQIL